MTLFRQSRVILLSIFSAVYLGPATPAYSYKPSKENYAKCHSASSIPTHFEQATDVVAATFVNHSDGERVGIYRVDVVWRGTLRVGETFSFHLPCYDRRHLMEIGKSYLFFVKPNVATLNNQHPLYESSSCFAVRPLGKEELQHRSSTLMRALDSISSEAIE